MNSIMNFFLPHNKLAFHLLHHRLSFLLNRCKLLPFPLPWNLPLLVLLSWIFPINTPITMIFLLSNTQQVIFFELTNTNYLYWQIQMKSYLIGQGIFHFFDGSLWCPTSHVVFTDGSSKLIFFFFITNNMINLF